MIMLGSAAVERIGEMRCEVGESPVWHVRDNALYWTDIPGRTLWRWDASVGRADSWALPEMAGSIAMLAGRGGDHGAGGQAANGVGSGVGSGVALAMETGVFRVAQPQPGVPLAEPVLMARVAHPRPDMRFNDGRCDRQGRFLAGTMVLDMSLAMPLGTLYRLDARQGSLASVCDALIVSNGLGFSPDGRTMYLSDSHPSRRVVWAFDYDIEAGVPHNRRVFIDMSRHAGRPDGAAVDADGCYWICGNDAGLVHRFTPTGKLDRSIAIPVSKPAMCAFGGTRLDTLFVTTIRKADEPLSGALFALDAGVKGLAEPCLQC